MKIDFKIDSPEGPVEFFGELSQNEVKTLLEFALIEMLRRGYMPLDDDKAERLQPMLNMETPQ